MTLTTPPTTITQIPRLNYDVFRRSKIVLTFLIALACCYPAQLLADDKPHGESKPESIREVIWSFDSNLLLFNKTLPDESMLEGAAGSFTIGYGRTRGNSWLLGKLHVISGPWDSTREGAFDADFSGSMVDIEYGTAFPGFNLRSGSTPILTLATGYIDLSGKNIGGNKKARTINVSTDYILLEQDFKTALSEVVLTPGIGWSWAKATRPASNEQKMLNTRIEASLLKINAIIPIYSRSRVYVTKRDTSDTSKETQRYFKFSGNARGYALEMSLSLWLGV